MSFQTNIINSFTHAASTYDEHAVLQQEVGNRLLERLSYSSIKPTHILDVGAGTGYVTQKVKKLYRRTLIISVDITLSMLQRARSKDSWWRRGHYLGADAKMLPLVDNSMDLILSNLMLPWCENIPEIFNEFHRVLRPNGSLLFSTLGPLTLQQLRQSWAQVDQYGHVNDFVDMHNIGDALLKSKFKNPVMEMELLTLNYSHINDLFLDLKATGTCNFNKTRRSGLTGKNNLQQVIATYDQFRNSAKKLPATFEVVYGQATKGSSDKVGATEKEVSIAIETIRKIHSSS